jgi:MinD-like ATPase involved in chromosome partitioning or flagellar assembly
VSRLPVATAVTDQAFESTLVAAWERGSGPIVARRCMDLVELLSLAAAGAVRAALVSPSLPGLDRESVARMSAAGVAVVLVGGDPDGYGAQATVAATTTPDDVARIVQESVQRVGTREPAPPTPPAQPGTRTGRLVAVWGPTGAPGRTTVAVHLAAGAAQLGRDCLLVDADVYGGTVALCLGLLDESAGLAAAVRMANAGNISSDQLARTAVTTGGRLRVLTGISRADRWPELRPAALGCVLDRACETYPLVVTDCGFSLEQDDAAGVDVLAPRRNAATFTVLEHADLVVAVGAADPVGLPRLVHGLRTLRESVAADRIAVVVNRHQRLPGAGEREVRQLVERHTGLAVRAVVPVDSSFAGALHAGRTLFDVAPRSSAAQALRALATQVAGTSPRRGRRRRHTPLLRRVRPQPAGT